MSQDIHDPHFVGRIAFGPQAGGTELVHSSYVQETTAEILRLKREVAELREALMAFHAIVGKWRDDGDYPDLDGLSAAVDRADKLLKSQSAQGGVPE